MPRKIEDFGQVATEQELLDFANAIRKAGGGDVIPALLPAIPSQPNACLIARALNFGCEVNGSFHKADGREIPGYKDGNGQPWHMYFGDGGVDQEATLSDAAIKQIAREVSGVRAVYVKHADTDEPVWALQLPRHIGNAAGAFDAGKAFQEYAVRK